MDKVGNRKPQRFIEQDLARRRVQQISSTHNLVDMHEGIIDDNGKLVGKDAVRTAYDEISYRLLYMLLRVACSQVSKSDDALLVDAKTPARTAAPGFVLLALGHR